MTKNISHINRYLSIRKFENSGTSKSQNSENRQLYYLASVFLRNFSRIRMVPYFGVFFVQIKFKPEVKVGEARTVERKLRLLADATWQRKSAPFCSAERIGRAYPGGS